MPDIGDPGARSVPAGSAGSDVHTLEPLVGAPGFIRVVARGIDIALCFGVTIMSAMLFWFVAGFLLAARGMSHEAISARLQGAPSVPGLVSALSYAMYHTVCEGLSGATVGKWVCGLVVVREDGSPCGVGEGFGRALAYPVDVLVAMWRMPRPPLRQRLGDRWMHTIVARRREVRPVGRPACLVPVAWLLGMGAALLILLSYELMRLVD